MPNAEDQSLLSYSTSTNSEQSLNVAKEWLRTCLNEHKCSGERLRHAAVKLPTRLLEVNEVQRQLTVRVVDAVTLQDVRYVTLSHSWEGVQHQVLKFTKANATNLRAGIHIDQLPRSFQDAVKITRDLSYRNLWIDALCIYQESEKDWAEESSRIGDIYAGCELNIAAIAALNSHGGFFRSRNPPASLRSRIDVSAEFELTVERENLQTTSEIKSPLLRRALGFPKDVAQPENSVLWL